MRTNPNEPERTRTAPCGKERWTPTGVSPSCGCKRSRSSGPNGGRATAAGAGRLSPKLGGCAAAARSADAFGCRRPSKSAGPTACPQADCADSANAAKKRIRGAQRKYRTIPKGFSASRFIRYPSGRHYCRCRFLLFSKPDKNAGTLRTSARAAYASAIAAGACRSCKERTRAACSRRAAMPLAAARAALSVVMPGTPC